MGTSSFQLGAGAFDCTPFPRLSRSMPSSLAADQAFEQLECEQRVFEELLSSKKVELFSYWMLRKLLIRKQFGVVASKLELLHYHLSAYSDQLYGRM
jgi:hypothetical protein